MTDLSAVLARADENMPKSLERLFDLVRIKSISTDPAFRDDCRKAAQWLTGELTALGFDASVRDTAGHPMVVGHHPAAREDAPHVLFYGHYDVQPIDPIELWEDDPFDPKLKDLGNGRKIVTGRGTSDDKGQLLTFVEACRAYKDIHGALPVRVTILFEGEEESGSPSLKPFLDAHADELKADYALVCDTGMWDGETPAITASLRGLVGEEIIVKAANRDLHSGMYGGAAANPIQILSKILAGLHDDDGKVTLEGFYDGVEETPANLKASWANMTGGEVDLLEGVGLSDLSGEKGRSILELLWARPTCEFNGITGGYTGQGFKTVIAAQASAKVSCRLVGQQDPEKIRASLRAYVRSKIPADCTVEFLEHGGSPAIQLGYDSPLLTKAKTALSDEWPKPAVVVGVGGSIPIVGDFQKLLGMESLLVGFGLSDDRVHSPNEKYDLTSYHKGIRSWARILAALAE